MICKKCGREFDPKKKIKGGYIWQCDGCSKKDVEKFVGRTNEKNEGITVFKTNLKYWSKRIKAESAVGFGANIPMNSPAGIQNREGMEEEDNR